MKTFKRTMLALVAVFIVMGMAACAPAPTSNDKQREAQEKILDEGNSQVGMPAIKNFREKKILKDIYELRDQTGLTTYTYVWSDIQAKLVFLCESIGYPIPYATQYSAPEAVQRYNLPSSEGSGRYYGHEVLPQAEPNGLFIPGSAEGTWVLCKDPNGKDVRPLYTEPRVIVSQFKLQG